jgi:hypothetical protein
MPSRTPCFLQDCMGSEVHALDQQMLAKSILFKVAMPLQHHNVLNRRLHVPRRDLAHDLLSHDGGIVKKSSSPHILIRYTSQQMLHPTCINGLHFVRPPLNTSAKSRAYLVLIGSMILPLSYRSKVSEHSPAFKPLPKIFIGQRFVPFARMFASLAFAVNALAY